MSRTRKLKIGALSSPRSTNGLRTIIDVLGEDVDFRLFEPGGPKELLLQEECDGYLLHNTLNVPRKVLEKSIVFSLQSITNKLIGDLAAQEKFKSAPPLDVWCNTKSAVNDLANVGISAVTMYRPAADFVAPDSYIPLSKEQSILWYFLPDVPSMVSKIDQIASSMSKVDANIYVFPAEQAPIEKNNIQALGRIDLSQWLPKVRGMVRVSDRLDFGRSTFDVLAYGRWALFLNMEEDNVFSVGDVSEIPGAVASLFQTENDETCLARFDRAKRYSLDQLRVCWLDRMQYVFC